MKGFLKSFALMMMAIVGAVACSEADIDDVTVDATASKTVLYATAGVAETKVSFTENDADGIDLAWEVDDEFTLYDGDTKVGTFTCTDAAEGKFESDDATLTSGTEYTAKYNESVDVYNQSGDDIQSLDDACQMEATFTYGDGATIEFEHTMAIMTFEFESSSKPTKLIFVNGDESYTVTYSSITAEDNLYTSHIMINPCDDTKRTLTFAVYTSSSSYTVYSTASTVAYSAGYRYTAPVTERIETSSTTWLGSGTESDPYQISTADQLRLLSTNVNSGTTYSGIYFKMTNDIDLGDEEFTAIGCEYIMEGFVEYYFCGTFDGDYHTVSGLYINDSETSCQGLFGYVDGATIKNLSVDGSVTGSQYVGGIVGYSDYSTIINCCNYATVTGSNSVNYVGGIAGSSYYGEISNCGNQGSITGSGYDVGGIVGYTTSTPITNCYNTGEIVGKYYVGGIVGAINYNNITNCYNAGDVTATSDTDNSRYGAIAGLVSAYIATSITYCYYLDNEVIKVYGSLSGSYYTLGPIYPMSDSEMKDGTFAETLGDNWKEDADNINSGYPILIWQ